MIHVVNTMWKIKNQPSNSASCSDNVLRLLVLVVDWLYWGLQVTSSFSIWGRVLKGCFERGVFWRSKSCLKGIGHFNLEHRYSPISKESDLIAVCRGIYNIYLAWFASRGHLDLLAWQSVQPQGAIYSKAQYQTFNMAAHTFNFQAFSNQQGLAVWCIGECMVYRLSN
jgi:hypothetical protein